MAFDVAQFVEKPNLETAQAYVASGEYYWNSGMFLFRAGRYLEELRKYRPDILSACESDGGGGPDLDFIRVDEEAFLACPEESIDYAVMERTADAVVVPMDAGWSDVGSGPPCGRSAPIPRRVTSITAMSLATKRKTATSTPSPARSPRLG